MSVSFSATAHNGGDDDKLTSQSTLNDDIRVYPNPAIDYIMITDNEAVRKVWIYNILGKRVKAYDVESQGMKFDIRDLPRGMYIVRLVDNNEELVMTRRINKINP
ncbi:MAG: T9SS type A sorting domain-containing protein [Saprospiraceae bacterium]|nr:T9SS type A sorting domain-containing protein [Saprospiraceae bacterium]